MMHIRATALLIGICSVSTAHWSHAQPPSCTPGFIPSEPKAARKEITLRILSTTHDLAGGGGELCSVLDAESVTLFKVHAEAFRKRFPELLELAMRSPLWEEAKSRSRSVNTCLLDITPVEKRRDLAALLCRNEVRFGGNTIEADIKEAKRWVNVLRDNELPANK